MVVSPRYWNSARASEDSLRTCGAFSEARKSSVGGDHVNAASVQLLAAHADRAGCSVAGGCCRFEVISIVVLSGRVISTGDKGAHGHGYDRHLSRDLPR